LYLAAGSPEKILLSVLISKTQALTGQIARRSSKDARQRSHRNDYGFISEDESRIGTIYYLMSEEEREKRTGPSLGFPSARTKRSQAPEGVS